MASSVPMAVLTNPGLTDATKIPTRLGSVAMHTLSMFCAAFAMR